MTRLVGMGVEAGCAIGSSTTIPIAMGIEAIWCALPPATWWGGEGGKEPGEEMKVAVDVDGLQKQPFLLPPPPPP